MSSGSSEAHNRVERSVVLVGFIEWAVVVSAALLITINLAFGFGSNDITMARLLLWHVTHIVIGTYLLVLVCARDIFAPRLLVLAALVAIVANTIGVVLAFSTLIDIFPTTSIFVYLYFAFHLAFGALAVALVFFAARAALTKNTNDDDDENTSVGFVESSQRMVSSLATTFVLPSSSSSSSSSALRQRRQ